MSVSLEDFEPPDLGGLDWDDQAEAVEVGTVNDRAYGWADGGVATCIRDLKAGPSTRLYRARVEGQVAAARTCIVFHRMRPASSIGIAMTISATMISPGRRIGARITAVPEAPRTS